MPATAIITKKHKAITTVLTFTRKYNINHNGIGVYSDVVECKKEEQGETFLKTSTFAYPGRFQKVDV